MSLDLSMFRDAAEHLLMSEVKRMSEEKRVEIMASQTSMAKQIGGTKPVWVSTPEDPDTGYTPRLGVQVNGMVNKKAIWPS